MHDRGNTSSPWDGTVVSEANVYDEQLLAGGEAVEGVISRIAAHPLGVTTNTVEGVVDPDRPT